MPGGFLNMRLMGIGLAGLSLSVCLCLQVRASAQQTAQSSTGTAGTAEAASSQRRVLDRYCVTCHNQKLKTAGLTLDEADVANPGATGEIWEKVVRKLRTSTMPPPNMSQPSIEDRTALI